MLYIVLVLVLAAFGLLIAALTTANTLWAWISVAVSVIAAALLIVDWLGGRRRAATEPATEPATDPKRDEGPLQHAQRDEGPLQRTPAEPAPAEALPAEPLPLADLPLADVPPAGQPPAEPPAEQPFAEPPPAEPPFDEPAAGSPAGESAVAESIAPPPETPAEITLADDLGEPGEEPTDAADLLTVAGLSVEVRVIDEHPRYHLASCTWLARQATIPIAVSEARQLGFTPCAHCGPDAALAAKHRADR